MISVQDAVRSAMSFAQTILGGANFDEAGSIAWRVSPRLEEVGMGKRNGEDVWVVTMSVPDPDALPFVSENQVARRVYKKFTVDANSGEVLSIKIRELANAK